MSEARLNKLRAGLARGLGQGEEDVRQTLGMTDASDRDAARALVQIVFACELAEVGSHQPRRDPAPVAPSEDLSPKNDTLDHVRVGSDDGASMDKLEDLRTLVGFLRAGTRLQRRAALTRLSERLAEPKGIPSDQIRLATDTLTSLRDASLAYELAKARESLPGAAGRSARAATDQWRKRAAKIELEEFWDGVDPYDPILSLPVEHRGELFLRVRDLPDDISAHLGSVIEGGDGVSTTGARRELVEMLRFGGDPRLVPALVSALRDQDPGIRMSAASALGHIDDPRVGRALVDAYDRAMVDEQRVALAGALGATGDRRGAEYVRSVLLEADAPRTIVGGLEASADLFGVEDSLAIAEHLQNEERTVVEQAVRTLGRIADARALGPLVDLAAKTRVPALRAELEEAERAIIARMELRGEEVERVELTAREEEPKERSRFGFRAYWDLLIGHMWLAMGAMGAAIKRYESSAERRPGWGAPLVSMAMAYSGREQHAQALTAFRRASESDRRRVERNPLYAHAMALAYLRRAEELESDGRVDVARGLIGEVLAMDLRRAPSSIRIELDVRRSRLHDPKRRALSRASRRAPRLA